MIRDYFALALTNLRQRGLRSLLTMLGIFIGIAAVVSLISLGAGLQDAITGQFSSVNPDILLVSNAETGFGPPGATAIRKLTEDDVEIIDGVKGVKDSVTRILRPITFEFNGVRTFTIAGSVPSNSDDIALIEEFLDTGIEDGKFLSETDFGKIVVGQSYKTEENFGRQIRVGSKIKIQEENFEVAGILEQSSLIFINDAVFMMEGDMEDILDFEDEIDLIIVQIENPDIAEEVALDLEREFRRDRKQSPGEEDFSIETPLQSVESVNTVLNIVQLIVAGIAGVSLLVGGIGIANTMYTSVLERTKEIGVMKAIGARNRDILSIFIIESALLGLVGGVIGALMGFGMALVASEAARAALGGALELAVQFDVPLVLMAISFSLFVGILAGIIPAVQASKLNPVDALRGN